MISRVLVVAALVFGIFSVFGVHVLSLSSAQDAGVGVLCLGIAALL